MEEQVANSYRFRAALHGNHLVFGMDLDVLVVGLIRPAMHDKPPLGEIQNPIFRNAGVSVTGCFAIEVEGGGRVGDFDRK